MRAAAGRLDVLALTVNGQLNLAGFTAQVGGAGSGNNFQTSNNGVLIMQLPTDSLIMVGGNSAVGFDGASTAGRRRQWRTSGTGSGSCG